MIQLLKSIKNVFASLFVLNVKISFYIVSFVFRTKIGYALYCFVAFFLFLLQTPAMAFDYPPTVRFLYFLTVFLFSYTMGSGIEIYIVYRLPWLKKQVEGYLGDDFMQRMVGDSSGRILFLKTIGPFYFFLLLDCVDYTHSLDMKSQEWTEYLKECKIRKQQPDVQFVKQLTPERYSYILKIRKAFLEFFKQV